MMTEAMAKSELSSKQEKNIMKLILSLLENIMKSK